MVYGTAEVGFVEHEVKGQVTVTFHCEYFFLVALQSEIQTCNSLNDQIAGKINGSLYVYVNSSAHSIHAENWNL